MPWHSLPSEAKKILLFGVPGQVHVRYRNRYGRERSYNAKYEGIVPYIERRHAEAETDTSRERFAGYMREVPCTACHGARLKPTSLAVTVGDKNIAEVASLSIDEAATFLSGLELTDREKQIAERVLKEINERLRFLLDVGLDYLSLSRPTASLSGGEAQRIRLATQIGSGLVGVLVRAGRAEHRPAPAGQPTADRDPDPAPRPRQHADRGRARRGHDPGRRLGGGHRSGRRRARRQRGRLRSGLRAAGQCEESLTGAYLSGRRQIALPSQRRPRPVGREITVHHATENNLQDITVSFPLGQLIAVTGVSGSGKSTLVNAILYTALAKRIYNAREVPGRHRSITGADEIDKIIHVDQSPIGRTPRSNPATYTGVFDHVRKLFAETPEAKVRGYQQGRFSFNVKGGRCENCTGDGTIKIEMNFLPDVYVPCEVCHGARYNRETLEVHYKGKTIAEVLDMSIEEGVDFFAALPAIARHLKTLNEVGLGYVRLGQPAPTLSGGEAQRVKLASELQKRSTGRTLYVLDEPTTGLHFEDIRKLLGVLGRLVDNGNTVVVIEHNLDVIKTADWLIDMGPEGGSRGGTVIDEGTPEKIAANPRSYTGEFLRPILEGREVPVGEAQPSLLDAGRGRPVTKAAAKRAAAEARQVASAAKKAAAAAKRAAPPAKKAAAAKKSPAAKKAASANKAVSTGKRPVAAKKAVSSTKKTAGKTTTRRTTATATRLAG